MTGYKLVSCPRIPMRLLNWVRSIVQPHPRKSKIVPVAIVEGNVRPILDTIGGRVHAVVGKDYLCGDYYD